MNKISFLLLILLQGLLSSGYTFLVNPGDKNKEISHRENLNPASSIEADQQQFKSDLEKQLRIAVADLGLSKETVPQEHFRFLFKKPSAEFKAKKQYILSKVKPRKNSRWTQQ